ncbi:DMT family transporter [Patulibacter defluvii]|uniref:DMT family transporter n=1 Tax=Patulibacter defluvii TaxID=3095358 RepID=UPI002A766157|nr:DMT family transporter [Patulibacter sp. DM4]
MSRRQSLLLLALAATWGGSYALIKVLLDHGLHWQWIASFRLLIGAAVVIVVAHRRLGPRPLRASAGRSILIGACSAGLSLPMISLGERWVASGLAGVLVAAAPLFTALFARLLIPSARLGRAGLVGMLVGFAGVVLLFGADLSGSSDLLLGGFVLLLAPLGYGIGAVLSRLWATEGPPLAQTAANLGWAAAIATAMALVATAAGEGAPALHGVGPWLALLVLGALGTGIAYLIFFQLIAEIGPSKAALVTYVVPIFALSYGAAFLDEEITLTAVAGVVLVIVGVLVANRPPPGAQSGRLKPSWVARKPSRS